MLFFFTYRKKEELLDTLSNLLRLVYKQATGATVKPKTRNRYKFSFRLNQLKKNSNTLQIEIMKLSIALTLAMAEAAGSQVTWKKLYKAPKCK